MYGIKITGLGRYLPRKVLTNDDVAEILATNRDRLIQQGAKLTTQELEQFETSDKWITERTGIKTRHMADTNEATSDLAVKAVEQALRHSGLAKKAVQLLVIATVSPDHLYSPPTSSLVQYKAGLPKDIMTMDTPLACSSFIAALSVAYYSLKAGACQKAIVVGADVMTRTVNWYNRNFSVILGDGAAGLVLEANGSTENFLVPPVLGSDGEFASVIMTPDGGSRQPLDPAQLTDYYQYLLRGEDKVSMNGRQVFELMVTRLPALVKNQLEKAGLSLEEVDFIAFHQANIRINERVEEKLRKMGLRSDTIVYNNIQKYGNTTSATIPLILYDAWKEGVLRAGMTVMLCAFGGGLIWGTAIFKWPALPEMF